MTKTVLLLGEGLEALRNPLETAGFTPIFSPNATPQPPLDYVAALLAPNTDPHSYHSHFQEALHLKDLPLLMLCPADSNLRQSYSAQGVDLFLSWPPEPVEIIQTLTWLHHSPPDWDPDTLGHDFKNPLGTIIASLGVAKELSNDSLLSKLIEDALRAAYRQDTLISDWMDYLRLSKNDFEYIPQAVPLDAFWTQYRPHAETSAATREIKLQWELDPNLPTLQLDPELLRRCLDALLDNSLKFCMRDSQMVWKCYPSETNLIISLKDTGRPIHTEFLPLIFTPNAQFSARLAGSRTSISANLAFVSAAAQRLGGKASAQHSPPWTLFSLTFPLSADSETR